MHLRSIIVPAAGLGTRLLPATKAVPKELLNVYDRPVLQFAIDEAIDAGAERIIVVIHPDKLAICDYLKPDEGYVDRLNACGNAQLWTHVFRPRTILYTALWSAIGILLIVALFMRKNIDVSVTPVRSQTRDSAAVGSLQTVGGDCGRDRRQPVGNAVHPPKCGCSGKSRAEGRILSIHGAPAPLGASIRVLPVGGVQRPQHGRLRQFGLTTSTIHNEGNEDELTRSG